jgi:hypothetical protein
MKTIRQELPPRNTLCKVVPEFGNGSFEAVLDSSLFDVMEWKVGNAIRTVHSGDKWEVIVPEKKANDYGLTKYDRPIKGAKQGTIDVYAVIETFDVRCPARQHAIKKLLCSGIRGKGSPLQDLKETKVAVDRAIQLQQERDQSDN